MSFKSKVLGYLFRKAMHYSVLEMCGLSTDYYGAKTDAQLIAKIRGWSWTCIDRNAKACAQVPLRLYTTKSTKTTKSLKTTSLSKGRHAFLHTKLAERVGTADQLEEVTDHPIIDLLRQVNPNNNAFDLKEITVKYLEAIGVDYWMLQRGVGGEILNIWPLQSQFVKVKLTKNEKRIASYEYKVGQHTSNFNPKDIIHFKYTSMTCPLKGDSPTKAGEQSIDLNEAMNQYEIANFKNGGNPSMVMEIPVESTLGDTERKRILANHRSTNGGVKNTGNLFIASGGAKVHEYGHKPKDMGFVQGRKTTLEETCGVYGVPLTFVVPTEISRDNLRSSIKLWMQFTINPKLTMIEQKLNEQFTRNWGEDLFLLFDDAIPVDGEQRLKEIETLIRTKYSSVNEERAKDGVDPAPWGDEPVEPQPIEVETVEEPKKAIEVVEKREGQTNDLPEPDFMPRVFVATMVRTFKAMEAEVIKNLKAFGKPKAIEDEASDAAFAASADDIISSVYNEAKWADEIAAQSAPFIRGLLDIGLVEAMELAKPGAVVNASSPAVLRALDDRAGQIRSVATTVQREIRDDIAESIAAGESRSGTIKRVRTQFDARFKADRVVRTETIWAHNEGTTLAWEQSGVVVSKKWDTVPDDRRCPYCARMHGKVQKLGSNFFDKGDSLTVKDPDTGNNITQKYNYEPIKHPPLHPNCRCQLIPIISDN
jgi:HK97 family phage portal protein